MDGGAEVGHGELNRVEFLIEKRLQRRLVGELEEIFFDEEIFVHPGGGVFDEGVVLFLDGEEKGKMGERELAEEFFRRGVEIREGGEVFLPGFSTLEFCKR